jgi:hypothetical protein
MTHARAPIFQATSQVLADIEKHMPFNRVLIFDGALVECKSFADEVLVRGVLGEYRIRTGLEFVVKSWPRDLTSGRIGQALLRSGKACPHGPEGKSTGEEVLWNAVEQLSDPDFLHDVGQDVTAEILIRSFNESTLHDSQRDADRIPFLTEFGGECGEGAEDTDLDCCSVCVKVQPGGGAEVFGVHCLPGGRFLLYFPESRRTLLIVESDNLSDMLGEHGDLIWLSVGVGDSAAVARIMRPSTEADAVGMLGGSPKSKMQRFSCAVEETCQQPSHGVCHRCRRHACSKHAYRGALDCVLACSSCGVAFAGFWSSLESEWSYSGEEEKHASSVANLASDAGHGLMDVCLVDSLRTLGFHVPYERSGPFFALADGNTFLEPFGRKLTRVPLDRDLPLGSFVVWRADHFFAAKKSPTGSTLLGEVPGDVKSLEDAFRDKSTVVYHVVPAGQEAYSSDHSDDARGGAMKRPASATVCSRAKRHASATASVAECREIQNLTNPLESCVVCGHTLYERADVPATLYGFGGACSVNHRQKQCGNKDCRRNYGYNYMWRDGKAVLCTPLKDLKALFVTSKTGFTIDYLEYHISLHFRGCVSARAVTWSGKDTLFADSDVPSVLRIMYEDARFLLQVAKEFQDMAASTGKASDKRLAQNIVIGDELTDEMIQAYDSWLHAKVFVPKRTGTVKALAIDGHEKVMLKLCASEDPPPRVGRPRKDAAPKLFSNGWFMMTDPACGRILSVEPMAGPENNDVAFRTIEKVISHYPCASVLIYDRACRLVQAGRGRRKLRQIRTWAVDKWHAYKHGKECVCSPWNHKNIERALNGLNTSVAEQTFSWFRSYASTFNSMRSLRHRFIADERYACAQSRHP